MNNYLVVLLFMIMCWQAPLYTMYTSSHEDAAKTRHRLALMLLRNIFKEKDGSLSLSNESRIIMKRMQLSKQATKKTAMHNKKKEKRQLDKDVGVQVIKARQKKRK